MPHNLPRAEFTRVYKNKNKIDYHVGVEVYADGNGAYTVSNWYRAFGMSPFLYPAGPLDQNHNGWD